MNPWGAGSIDTLGTWLSDAGSSMVLIGTLLTVMVCAYVIGRIVMNAMAGQAPRVTEYETWVNSGLGWNSDMEGVNNALEDIYLGFDGE